MDKADGTETEFMIVRFGKSSAELSRKSSPDTFCSLNFILHSIACNRHKQKKRIEEKKGQKYNYEIGKNKRKRKMKIEKREGINFRIKLLMRKYLTDL